MYRLLWLGIALILSGVVAEWISKTSFFSREDHKFFDKIFDLAVLTGVLILIFSLLQSQWSNINVSIGAVLLASSVSVYASRDLQTVLGKWVSFIMLDFLLTGGVVLLLWDLPQIF